MPPHPPGCPPGPTTRYCGYDEWHARSGVFESEATAFDAMHHAWAAQRAEIARRETAHLTDAEHFARATLHDEQRQAYIGIMHATIEPFIIASFYELAAQEGRYRKVCCMEEHAERGEIWDRHVMVRPVRCHSTDQCVATEAEKRMRMVHAMYAAHNAMAGEMLAGMVAAKVKQEAPLEAEARRGIEFYEGVDRESLYRKITAMHPGMMLVTSLEEDARARGMVAREERETRARLEHYLTEWEDALLFEQLADFEGEVRGRIEVDQVSAHRVIAGIHGRLLLRVLEDVESRWREYLANARVAELDSLRHVSQYGCVGLLTGTRLVNLGLVACREKDHVFDLFLRGLGDIHERDQREAAILRETSAERALLRRQMGDIRAMSRSALSHPRHPSTGGAGGGRSPSMRSVRFYEPPPPPPYVEDAERVERGRLIRRHALEFDALASACVFQAEAMADLAARRAYIAHTLAAQLQREAAVARPPSHPRYYGEAPFYQSKNRETWVRADHAQYVAHQLPVNATVTTPQRYGQPHRGYTATPTRGSPAWG